MKTKLLASGLLMASALIASGTAYALTIYPIYAGTLDNWGLVNTITDTDPDHDMTFTLNGFGGLNAAYVDVTIMEIQDAGANDLYDIAYSFNTTNPLSPYSRSFGYIGSAGFIAYTMATTDNSHDLIDGVRLDSSSIGRGELVTKDIFASKGGSLLATLTSISGQPDPIYPLQLHYFHTPTNTVYVVDNLDSKSGIIHSVSSQFDPISVPEPMTLTLMGIGLAALGVRRRFA